jgi:hypothetical protein
VEYTTVHVHVYMMVFSEFVCVVCMLVYAGYMTMLL